MGLWNKIVGSSHNRVIRDLQKTVDKINLIEPEVQKLTASDFVEKTNDWKKELAGITEVSEQKKILENILPEAFALVREAANRIWHERHFDVQIIGGLVLHQGKIAEMKTGEGKTLVATLPLYLNALCGRGAHLVTVNDYLSKMQGEGMGEIYNYLGLSVGVIQSNQESFKFKKTKEYAHYSECDGGNLEQCSRKEAYACDITYGTNNEFGFDYLRDNMAPNLEACSQREQFFAIVDEVDSILIDEARTPLIISAPAEESASMYQQFASYVPKLKSPEDYTVDEKDRVVSITDLGIKKIEKMLGVENIYEQNGIMLVHHLEEALKAHALFKRDRDYVVKDGEIIIVDEFTGRLMVGRRYSEGLHQAIEAKEGVEVKRESQTLATISFQNLFRMYDKLSGMTGTAATEAEEFYKIYTLDVVEIPTNKPMIRKDLQDKIYKSYEGKFKAIVEEVRERNKKGQPVLIGTVSVEKNEYLSKLLRSAGIKHQVLNAKHHDKEAKIIAKAGQVGAVTVATNMAGRGTDIRLDEESRKVGGLFVLGSERHEARRIDNQLRGRSGRQGDPGESCFFVSMEDDLMRIFGGERMKTLMDKLGLPEDQPIENAMVSRSIEGAQKKVEGHNFDIRKHLVEYDDVMNKHREVIYRKRRKILEIEIEKSDNNLKDEILGIIDDEIDRIVITSAENKEHAVSELKTILGDDADLSDLLPEKIKKIAKDIYQDKEQRYTPEIMRSIEKMVYLRMIDMLWVEHLTTMDDLRTSIGLRSYGQQDPLIEYKQEAYKLYEQLISAIEINVARTIFKVEVQVAPTAPIRRAPLEYTAPDPDTVGDIENMTHTDSLLPTSSAESADYAGHSRKDTENEEQQENNPETITNNQKNNFGVTTTIREKGKTVHDRMMENAGTHTVHSAKKVGRNEPCPCGAKKADGRPIKYKHCCGR